MPITGVDSPTRLRFPPSHRVTAGRSHCQALDDLGVNGVDQPILLEGVSMLLKDAEGNEATLEDLEAPPAHRRPPPRLWALWYCESTDTGRSLQGWRDSPREGRWV